MSSFTPDPFNFQPDVYIFPDEFNEDYSVKLRQYLNDIAISLNAKENGFYVESETPTAGLFIPTYSTDTAQNSTYRAIYRTVVDTGALPNTGTIMIPHNISTTQDYSIIHIFGGATDPGLSTIANSIPLPYASPTLADNVSVDVDATDVIITTGNNRSAYTRSFIVIEYIKEI